MEGADAGAQARHRRCFLGVRMMADREPVTRNKERCFEVSGVCWSVLVPASLVEVCCFAGSILS